MKPGFTFLLAVAGTLVVSASSLPGSPSIPPERLKALRNVALYFEGSDEGLYRARGCNYDFAIAPTELGVWLAQPAGEVPAAGKSGFLNPGSRSARGLRITFPGANPAPRMQGAQPGTGRVHYLQGSDPARWRRDVATYASVRVRQLFDGVDVVYYGNQRHLEYDFEVAPGADPAAIRVRFEGADGLRLNEDGSLRIPLGDRVLEQPKPVFYQVIDGQHRSVEGGFHLIDDHTLAFHVGPYDRNHTLILDPILSYSSYFGGNGGDIALAVKLDLAGNVYMAGQTLSTRFPMTLPPGGFQPSFGGGKINGDAFLAKFAPDGSLVYFTYLGGDGNDGALDLAVDGLGQARLAGFTDSPDFPTRNALFPAIAGGEVPAGAYYADAFVAQLNGTGSDLVFSTFLGGAGIDSADAVALDPEGHTYVAGYTYSTNFPVTPGSLVNASRPMNRFQGGLYDGFVAKLSPGGNRLVYSSYLGGTNVDEVQGIAADAQGFAYVTGYTASTNFPTVHAFRNYLNGWPRNPLLYDAFVAKIDPLGQAFAFSTFLGGTNKDAGFRIAVDTAGAAYVTGSTLSRDFPNSTTNVPGLKVGFTGSSPSVGDAFMTRINPDGSLGFSSRFGGPQEDVGWDVALDAAGNIFVVGTSSSYDDFPQFAADGWPVPKKDRAKDPIVFVTAFNSSATALLYSIVLGGERQDYGYGIAADPAGNVYIVGRTLSPNFPLAEAAQPTTSDKNDAFLTKINLEPRLQTAPTPDGVAIRWRAFSPEYRLEAQPGTDPTALWSPLSATPQLKGGWHELRVPMTNDSSLFRLRRAE